MRSTGREPAIDRLSPADLMSLVGDTASVPMQVGVVLDLRSPEPLDIPAVLDALEARIAGVPRLRRRLHRPAPGGGRPIWIDDPHFDISHHVSVSAGGDGEFGTAVLRRAADLVTTPLNRRRPLWAAQLVAGGTGEAALIVVFHHVVADGIGGLAVLAALADGAAPADDPAFPRRRPRWARLAADAWAERFRAIGSLPAALARLVGASRSLGPALRQHAPATSLNRPTGRARRFVTLRCRLSTITASAAAHDSTLNDIVLTAVGGALTALLAARGEQVDPLVVSVPFSSRQTTDARQLGNRSGVVPIVVPTHGTPEQRLAAVHIATRHAKEGARGASTSIIGPIFRLLARTGLYRRFIDSQRMIHTFVTNVRGPEAGLRLAGRPITAIVPLSLATGNVTVAFAVLSYAGEVVITLVADPEAVPDLDLLKGALATELESLAVPVGPV